LDFTPGTISSVNEIFELSSCAKSPARGGGGVKAESSLILLNNNNEKKNMKSKPSPQASKSKNESILKRLNKSKLVVDGSVNSKTPHPHEGPEKVASPSISLKIQTNIVNSDTKNEKDKKNSSNTPKTNVKNPTTSPNQKISEFPMNFHDNMKNLMGDKPYNPNVYISEADSLLNDQQIENINYDNLVYTYKYSYA
jgi:hypothetical protein